MLGWACGSRLFRPALPGALPLNPLSRGASVSSAHIGYCSFVQETEACYCVIQAVIWESRKFFTLRNIAGTIMSSHGKVAIYSSSEVNQALKSVTSPVSVRSDYAMIMAPYANWEQFLMPAPISIAILGQLAAISTAEGDFSINLNPPEHGFKHMKYPNSFSASLMQVCNRSWGAFNIANKNMDQIRLLSSSIPNTSTEIVQLLFSSTEIVNTMLPMHLNKLRSVANECTSLAKSVEGQFNEAINLIQEMLEACLNSKKGYEDKLDDVKIALEQLALRQESAKQSVEMAEELKKTMTSQLDNATQAYKEATDSVPSVWQTLAVRFCEGLMNPLLLFQGRHYEYTAKSKKADAFQDAYSTFANANVCSKSNQLLSITDSLQKVIGEDGNIDMKIVRDKKKKTVTTNYVKTLLTTLKCEIGKESACDAKSKALPLIQSGISICEDLEKATKPKTKNEVDLKQTVEQIKMFLAEAITFDSYSKSYTNSAALTPNAPNIAANGDLAGTSLQMAHAKVQETRQQMEKTQQMYMKSFDNFQVQNQKLTDILVEMKSYDLKKIDFEKAKEMLVKGLRALGMVKEQWEKMILFFQMMSNLIESCLSKRVNEFVESAKNAHTIANYSAEAYVKDLIYKQAFTVCTIANLVTMISGTYCEVSQKYLMDRVSALGRLITTDPSSPEFCQEREMLQQGCTEAQNAIMTLVTSKRQEFDMMIEKRVDTINRQLAEAILAIPAEERKCIEDAVRKGHDEADLADEAQSETPVNVSDFI